MSIFIATTREIPRIPESNMTNTPIISLTYKNTLTKDNLQSHTKKRTKKACFCVFAYIWKASGCLMRNILSSIKQGLEYTSKKSESDFLFFYKRVL